MDSWWARPLFSFSLLLDINTWKCGFLKKNLFSTVLGLSCRMQVSSSLGEQSYSPAAEHGLWSVGSAVVMHGLSCSTARGIFSTRDGTHVPCIGRWISNHWASREVLHSLLNEQESGCLLPCSGPPPFFLFLCVSKCSLFSAPFI